MRLWGVNEMSEATTQQLLDKIDELTAELDKAQHYDTLTRLYNRNTYYESVRRRLDRNPDREYVIVCLDIEKFKYINDRFGFTEGDRLLAYIGEKLYERALKFEIIASRLGGDKFSFLDERKNIDTEAFGHEVRTWVNDYPLDTEIKIAVGVYPVDIRNIPVRLMCDRANMAIASIKNNYMVYSAEYNKNIRDYMFSQNELLADVERAFCNKEFKVYLQPKYDIRTNKIVGAESLVRWLHPERGLVPPKDFIPLFEHNMLITRLDEYIWEETCRIVSGWIKKGYRAVPVSVNVSRLDIYSLEISNKFPILTEKYGIDNSFIEIEITESAFTNDESQILKVVDELRNGGFKVLMDDFGSGYSSLNILKDINVDVLKIDTRFLEAGRKADNKGREILESVIRMAKWIGLQTIAEGVETDEHKKFLMDLGCYYAQGYYFSKPISEEEFEDIIKNPENVVSDIELSALDNTIAIEELFHSDFMTEGLLNNILGGVAIYAFDGRDNLRLMKANEFYYTAIGEFSSGDINLLDRVYPDDRKMLLDSFKRARETGVRGTAVNIRIMSREKERWFSMRIFFLADKEEYGMYYASVSDFSEQMSMMSELDLSRRGFATALELIDATVLEYDFNNKALIVKTKPESEGVYILGKRVEDALRKIIRSGVVNKASMKIFENMCRHLKYSDETISCELKLMNYNKEFRQCRIMAKSIRSETKPVKAIIIIKLSQEETV